ncbi:hypothetical protein [Rummeliibacillus pycnus]|uniref:hypothetical protein n=1 Tax=Rummeliibacillus pycnus TaxID=101070 RepID=UPI003D2E0EA0
MEKEWTFMIDGTEHLRKEMEEVYTQLPIENRDGEEFVTIKYKDFKKLVDFYIKEHSSDLPF